MLRAHTTRPLSTLDVQGVTANTLFRLHKPILPRLQKGKTTISTFVEKQLFARNRWATHRTSTGKSSTSIISLPHYVFLRRQGREDNVHCPRRLKPNQMPKKVSPSATAKKNNLIVVKTKNYMVCCHHGIRLRPKKKHPRSL